MLCQAPRFWAFHRRGKLIAAIPRGKLFVNKPATYTSITATTLKLHQIELISMTASVQYAAD
jgi:hypothetical protein